MINSNCEGDLLLSFRSVAVRCGAVRSCAQVSSGLIHVLFLFLRGWERRKVR